MSVDKGFQVCKGVFNRLCWCPTHPQSTYSHRKTPSAPSGRPGPQAFPWAAVRAELTVRPPRGPAAAMVTLSTRRPEPAPAHSCPGGAPGDHRPSAIKLVSLSQGLLGNLNPDRLFRRTCLKKGLRVTALGAAAPGSVCDAPWCRGETTGASITPPQAALSGLRVSRFWAYLSFLL